MVATKAQLKANYKYKAKTYKRIPLDYPLADLDDLTSAAAAVGESINGFIKTAIKKRIEEITKGQS